MNCAELESTLADYVDGTLPAEERLAIDRHLAGCSNCREFLEEIQAAAAMLERVSDVEPPAELITRIAYQAPLGKTRHPFDEPGPVSRFLSRWLTPILQPRLAMGMAMTILSFAMLERCTGIQTQHIQAADLNPVRVWGGIEDRTLRVRDRVVKYYDNLRIVYEVESRLKDLQEKDVQEQDASPAPAAAKPNDSSPKQPNDFGRKNDAPARTGSKP